jgi:GDP/UDP-N,N'-diacetylbacillosamine 2-epimerase (hydrolysing)
MKRILVPIGCRSDEGLSAPVIKRLREHFEVMALQLEPQNFGQSYKIVDYWCRDYDLVLITGDRVEMCAAAAAAFHNKVPIAHFYAGVINDPITTFDDIDRHCITLWSDIIFCESLGTKQIATDLWFVSSGKKTLDKKACYIVGISHLDDLEIDESKVPRVMENGTPLDIVEPYALLLMNAEPLNTKGYYTIPWGGSIIQIGGNPDGTVRNHSEVHPYKNQRVSYYPNLPRPQFLGLLKNCQRFITNSSAAIYEAPYFLKPEQIVMVGDRNKNRPRGPIKTGASDRIVEILREYLK